MITRDANGKETQRSDAKGHSTFAGAFPFLLAQRREWLTMSELSEISAHPGSQESKNEDKSSGLDIGHNQEIRTVTIGRISSRNLAGKHAASMLRRPTRV